MIIVGIDPGRSGGMVKIDGQGRVLEASPIPYIDKDIDVRALAGFLGKATHVCIERVHAMPNQGVVSMFTFGKGFGELRATSILSGAEVSLVRPQDWKKLFGLSGKKKEAAADMFLEQQPHFKMAFNKATLSGIADAYFIAQYMLPEVVFSPHSED